MSSFLPFRDIPIGGGGSNQQPFDIISASEANSFLVLPGTINNVLPANWNTFRVNVGTNPTHPTVYVYLTVNSSSNRITTATLSSSNSYPDTAQIPVQGGLPTSFNVSIGMIINRVAYRLIGEGSLIASAATISLRNFNNDPQDSYYALFNYWVIE